jgi:phage/plasmid-associated DNA primase
VFLIGEGRNGKGVVMKLMKAALGDYYHNIHYTYFTKDTKSHDIDVYSGRKARILNVSEPPKAQKFKTDTFKGATGGDDIECRTHQQKVTESYVMPPCWFQANHFIRLTHDTEGNSVKKRFKAIRFPNTFVSQADIDADPKNDTLKLRNNNIKDNLKKVKYKQAIMEILVDKYKELNERDKEARIQTTLHIDKSTEEYFNNLSDDKEWFLNNLEKNGTDNYRVRELYDYVYKADEQQDIKTFRAKLKEFKYKIENRKRGINILTGEIKQGQCVMNVNFIGEKPNHYTDEEDEEDDNKDDEKETMVIHTPEPEPAPKGTMLDMYVKKK